MGITATAEKTEPAIDVEHMWIDPAGAVHERMPFNRLMTRCGEDTRLPAPSEYIGLSIPRGCRPCALARIAAEGR